jgi:hypothetical protein
MTAKEWVLKVYPDAELEVFYTESERGYIIIGKDTQTALCAPQANAYKAWTVTKKNLFDSGKLHKDAEKRVRVIFSFFPHEIEAAGGMKNIKRKVKRSLRLAICELSNKKEVQV